MAISLDGYAGVDDVTHANDQHMTYGTWQVESDSCDALDRILERHAFWQVHKEVCGRPTFTGLHQETKGLRIDRVLIPTPKARSAGWCFGPVGIECKRSGEKIGRATSQMLDYQRALWKLPNGDVWFALNWVFLWPARKLGGPVASVMAQNRLGTVSHYMSDLTFDSGGHVMARMKGNGSHEFSTAAESIGRKTGSR